MKKSFPTSVEVKIMALETVLEVEPPAKIF